MTFLRLIIVVITFVNISAFANAQKANFISPKKKLEKLEKISGVKIGVYSIDTNSAKVISYRADERFPVQSTMKLIGVSALLKLSYKDNPAINLIMKKLGGPKSVTTFAHSIGNETFNVEHYEGNLNSNPRDKRDTSTPKDMATSLQKLTLNNILRGSQRKQLIMWMRNNTTGYKRIRAGVPNGWAVADKTGSGNFGIANDIGIVWSPTCKPIVLAIYTIQNKHDAKWRDDIVAKVTNIILNTYSKMDPCFNSTSLKLPKS